MRNGRLIAIVQFDRGTQFDGMEIVPERDAANGEILAAAPEMAALLSRAILDRLIVDDPAGDALIADVSAMLDRLGIG